MDCPHCGKAPPADAVFCNYCGKSLGKEGASADPLTPTLSAERFGVKQPEMSVQAPPEQPNHLQRYLLRTFDASLAGNALFGVLLGSIVAVVGAAFSCWLLITMAHLVAASFAQTFYRGVNIDFILGIVPLSAPVKDSLQLFLVIQGIGADYTSSAGSHLYTMPLNGLLVIPALLLTLGGYISACTDFQNRAQRSLLRGGAIAIPYTLLLFIITTQINGSASSPQAVSTSVLLSMDTTTLVIFGLLWGVLFGVLGASLKLAHGQWRHMLRRYVQTGSQVQFKGMLAGGLSAGGLGCSLALLWLCCALPFLPVNLFLFGDGCGGGPWQVRILWDIAQGPWYALNFFFLSLGAPLTAHLPQSNEFLSCFATPPNQHVLALTDGALHLPVWLYVSLLLIPAVSLFQGGRVSAALSGARVKGVGPRMVQGAAIALPFTVLMLLCTLLGTVTDVPLSPTGIAATTATATVGVGAFDLLPWALLWTIVLGALGGAYQQSTLQRTVQSVVTGLALPFAWLGRPLFILLDHLSGIRRPATRSRARSLLYGTCLACLLLLIVSLASGAALIIWDQTISFSTNQLIKNVLSCVTIALPGLLFICTGISALRHDPVA